MDRGQRDASSSGTLAPLSSEASAPEPCLILAPMFRPPALALLLLLVARALARSRARSAPGIVAAQQPAPADLIVHNAVIYTVNAAQPKARAIAVRGDRIVLVGDDAGGARAARPVDPRRRRAGPRGRPRPARRARALHRARRQPAADRPARHDVVRGDRRQGEGARRRQPAGRMDSRPQLGSERLGRQAHGRPATRSTARRRTTRSI